METAQNQYSDVKIKINIRKKRKKEEEYKTAGVAMKMVAWRRRWLCQFRADSLSLYESIERPMAKKTIPRSNISGFIENKRKMG